MKVSVNVLGSNRTARELCLAMATGINACGDEARIRKDTDHNMDNYQAMVIYGFVPSCRMAIESAKQRNIPWVFIDLAYWARDRYFKVVVNERHPHYVMELNLPSDRWEKHKLKIKEFSNAKEGGPILLAGMSAKAAGSFDCPAEWFERKAVATLQKYTKRPIIYRPKPSWPGFSSLQGTTLDRTTPYAQLLGSSFAVVSHHSNVGCDALVAGVPAFTQCGAALPLALSDLSKIETPKYPSVEERYKWASNLSYFQWTFDEMRTGECWRFLRESGLVF